MTNEDADLDVPATLLEAAQVVMRDKHRLAHHLAKAAVERWFAFELAAALDKTLGPGWMTLVEAGGKGKALGNFDLLVLPTEKVRRTGNTAALGSWTSKAIVVELKHARLNDGPKAYADALLADLTVKPRKAGGLGRSTERWFGMQITTDGTWGKPNGQTLKRRDKMSANALELNDRLVRHGRVVTVPDLKYGDWNGNAWVEVVVPASK